MNDENDVQQTAEELTDIEIGELANKEIRKRDSEIAQLKKELAKAKLYTVATEEKEAVMTKEDCLKVIGDNHTTNYDYANAVVELCDREAELGNPNPLGPDGEKIKKFFADVIEECDGDKSLFPSIYQARLGADEPAIAMAYKKRKGVN